MVKVMSIDDDLYDAIKISGGPGRTAKPSALAAEVAEAVKLLPAGKPESDRDGWAMIKATQANPNAVTVRELRKAQKQHNGEYPGSPIKVETRPRENHPKYGSFVAFRAYPVPPVEDEASSGGDSSK